MNKLCTAPNPVESVHEGNQIPTRLEMMEHYRQVIHEALFQYSIFSFLDEEQSRAYILRCMEQTNERKPDE